MKSMDVQEIGLAEINLIKDFIENAGNSTETFRYFEKRPLTCIDKHLVTIAVIINERMVGYGHLDPAEDGVWLGIAVAEGVRGKGFGNKIMEYLVSHARYKMIETLKLSVDKINVGAIALYSKFGFKKVRSLNKHSILMELNSIS